MKDKVVEYFAGEINHRLNKAMGDVQKLQRAPGMPGPTEGIGLDLACLKENIEEAQKMLHLLEP